MILTGNVPQSHGAGARLFNGVFWSALSWCSLQFLLSKLYILFLLAVQTLHQERRRKQVEIDSGVSVVRKHELVLHCQSFLEVILYNTKAVVHFLLPDFFSCVCVCNIV